MSDKATRETLTINRKKSVSLGRDEVGKMPLLAERGRKNNVAKQDEHHVTQQRLIEAKKQKRKKKPSEVRASDLNSALGKFSKVWRSHKPLALDIEKQVFKFISDGHISASKRVVKAMLKRHNTSKNYLLAMQMDASRYSLNGDENGVVIWEDASNASKLLVRVEAQRKVYKRSK